MKRLPLILAGASFLVGSISVYAQTQQLPKEPGAATEQSPGEGSQKQLKQKEGQGNRATNGERMQNGQADQGEDKNKQDHQRGGKEQKSGDSSPGDKNTQKREQAGGDQKGSSSGERPQQGGGESKGDKGQQHAGKKLEPKQRTVVKETIVKRNVHPAKVNFSIRVGAVVPRTVTLYDLPPVLIEYEPSYSHYKFIMADDDTILVIDPETWTIVDVIEI